MKVGRNDPCPCGSGKKYKQCCLKREVVSDYDLIRNIVLKQNYSEQMSDFLCSMYRYMKEQQWIGACHATCSVMYVALAEMGYNVQLCLGEVAAESFHFDHSWLLVDNKIIDLAVAMTLMGGCAVSNPVILDKDIYSNAKYSLKYGIQGSGLDREAMLVKEIPFVTYMDNFPSSKKGLWGVLEKVYPGKIDIEELRKKYEVVERKYVIEKG